MCSFLENLETLPEIETPSESTSTPKPKLNSKIKTNQKTNNKKKPSKNEAFEENVDDDLNFSASEDDQRETPEKEKPKKIKLATNEFLGNLNKKKQDFILFGKKAGLPNIIPNFKFCLTYSQHKNAGGLIEDLKERKANSTSQDIHPSTTIPPSISTTEDKKDQIEEEVQWEGWFDLFSLLLFLHFASYIFRSFHEF